MTYTTVQGDMWDLISHKVYGDVRFADVLISANPQYRDVLIFSAGVTVDVPAVDVGNTSDNLPIWLKAEG